MARMRELGFVLDYFDNHGVWSERYPNIQQNAYLFSQRGKIDSDVPVIPAPAGLPFAPNRARTRAVIRREDRRQLPAAPSQKVVIYGTRGHARGLHQVIEDLAAASGADIRLSRLSGRQGFPRGVGHPRSPGAGRGRVGLAAPRTSWSRSASAQPSRAIASRTTSSAGSVRGSRPCSTRAPGSESASRSGRGAKVAPAPRSRPRSRSAATCSFLSTARSSMTA